MKRQIGGTHHGVSQKHLHRYVGEAEFKYNNRGLDDGQRTAKLMQAASGRRVTYAQQVTNRDQNNQKLIYGAIAAPNAICLA